MTALTTVDELAARLSAAILSGEIPAETWLRQEAIAERYGVSRQPVREALRQLQAYGMVEIHPRRGALVRRPSPRDVREAYLVRAEVEGLAASLAAQHITLDELDRLRKAEAAFERVASRAIDGLDRRDPEEVRAWSAANDVFHETILGAAGARIITRTVEQLHLVVPRGLTGPALRTPRLVRQNIAEHQRITGAIESGDAEAAREAMRVHVRSSGELIVAWLERQEQDAGFRALPHRAAAAAHGGGD